METVFISIGSLLGGLIVGILLGLFLGKRSSNDVNEMAENLTAKIFAKSADQILRLAESKLTGKKEVIDGTLQAMKSELSRVEKLMKEIEAGNIKVDTRLENASKVIKELSDTTGNLSNALASNSGRGQWGERMAEDVLRLAGLMEGVNYIKQKKLGAAGSKPDFTFLLPKKLRLNMDVKFPFNNYQLYVEAKSEKDKEDYKKKFIKDIRQRLKEVQTRDYINPEDQTMDYVLMFVPNEQIFGFINEIDRTIIDDALEGKTILCSPMSLYAILSVIRQSIDNFNLESQSREMLSIFATFKQQWIKFKEQMETVKARIDSAGKAYDELTTTRTKKLDLPLNQIEGLRIAQSIEPALIEEKTEKITRKNLSATIKEEFVSNIID